MRISGTFFIMATLLASCSAPTATDDEISSEPEISHESVENEGAQAIDPLVMAAQSDIRSSEEQARDQYRHPVETLQYIGVEPDHTVVEVWPGGGWYTNILAPYLASGGGTLVAAGWDLEAFDSDRRERIAERLDAYKQNYSDPKFGTIIYSAFSAQSGPLAEAASADVVLTFRNIHNWMSGGYTEKFFTDSYEVLKPGGVLGVVEHRLPSTAEQDPKGATGYVHEDYVKALALAAGFEFAGASEINANPKDTADHPFGVWTLPPNSRKADRDGNTPADFNAEVYTAIGESDRMTLKFIKPE